MDKELDVITEKKADSEGTAPKSTEDKQPNLLAKLLSDLMGKDKGKEDQPAAKDKTDPPKADEDKKSTSVSEQKSLTDADLKAAIEEAKAKWEKDQAEQARLAKLPPDDRAKEEAKAKEEELQQLRNKVMQRELQDKATAKLREDGFPAELATIIPYLDEKRMGEHLETVEKVFAASLASAVKEKLRGTTPPGLGGSLETKDDTRSLIAKNIRGGLM